MIKNNLIVTKANEKGGGGGEGGSSSPSNLVGGPEYPDPHDIVKQAACLI